MINKKAFTLSEVLITLGIIGVIAAITLPTIIQNYQKQVTVNKLKKVYSVLSQMIQQTVEENGTPDNFLSSGSQVTSENTQKFFETYWLPYFNSPTVAKQGTSFYNLLTSNDYVFRFLRGAIYDTSIKTLYNAGRILFKTNDGTIYFVSIMKWEEEKDKNGNVTKQTAVYSSTATILVDINGTDGPNTFGKDVFRFKASFNTNKVTPLGYDSSDNDINTSCSKNGNGYYCAAKIMRDGWQIKSDYPW